MTILGRSPNLVIALAGAVFNAVVAFHVGGFDPSVEQIGIVNVLILAIVGFIANTASIQIAAGEAAAKRTSQ